MAKRLENMKKINKALVKIMDGTNDLINMNKILKDKELKFVINYFTLLYATEYLFVKKP